MELRTVIPIAPFQHRISHSEQILSLGSCFAENIATRLANAKFHITASPTGILFNPESIALAIERMANRHYPTMTDLHYSNEKWFSYDFHSSFSHSDVTLTLEAMRQGVDRGAEAITSADTYIITFGTAIVYRLAESGHTVANCHKQPQSHFTRQMLSVEEIVERYKALLEGVLKNKRVIFTVSPIRHLSEGLEENSLSKAILRVAIGELTRQYPNTLYFPSFEIVNDELRDYRFYADDMTHPSPLAIDYIWERFSEAAFTPATRNLIEQIKRITTAAAHRPFNPDSDSHRTFCRRQLDEITKLESQNAEIDFSAEKATFTSYL